MQAQYRDGDWVQVTDGQNSVPVPRQQYESKGYKPPFGELLTEEQFRIRAKGVSFGDNAWAGDQRTSVVINPKS